MELPQIPTDNLYKFMSIFGLVILVSTCYLSITKGLDLAERLYNTKLEASVVEINTTDLENQIKITQDKVNSLKTTRDIAGVNDEVAKLLSTEKDLKLQSAKLQNDAELSGFYVQMYHDLLKYYSYPGIIIGSVLSFLGFLLWYVRLQRYQDRKVQK